MQRALTLVLCAYLLVVVPGAFSAELFSSWSSLRMRGAAGAVELTFHGAAAAICAAAGYMLIVGAPDARAFGRAAVLLDAARSLQSLYWSRLPRQTAPGEAVPFTILTVALCVFWLWVLRGAAGGDARSAPSSRPRWW